MDRIAQQTGASCSRGFSPLNLLAVSEDGVVAASAITGYRVQLWRIVTGEVLAVLSPRRAAIVSLEFTDGDTLVLCDAAGATNRVALSRLSPQPTPLSPTSPRLRA